MSYKDNPGNVRVKKREERKRRQEAELQQIPKIQWLLCLAASTVLCFHQHQQLSVNLLRCEWLDTPDTEDEISQEPDVPVVAPVDTGNIRSSEDIVAVDDTGTQLHPPVCDIGLWPNGKLPDSFVEFWVECGSLDCQHIDANFTKSGQNDGKQKRWFSAFLFSRVDSLTGEKISCS